MCSVPRNGSPLSPTAQKADNRKQTTHRNNQFKIQHSKFKIILVLCSVHRAEKIPPTMQTKYYTYGNIIRILALDDADFSNSKMVDVNTEDETILSTFDGKK